MAKRRGRRNYNWLIVLIIAIVLAGIILLINHFIEAANTEKGEELEAVTSITSELQEMLHKDFQKSYPPTPREVAKYHAKITKVLYNDTYTEEEFQILALKALELYDDEFATEKEQVMYLEDLQDEILLYHSKGWSIKDYKLTESEQVVYSTKDGEQLAQLFCNYIIKTEGGSEQIDQSILFRMDEDGNYKIMGWKLALDEGS